MRHSMLRRGARFPASRHSATSILFDRFHAFAAGGLANSSQLHSGTTASPTPPIRSTATLLGGAPLSLLSLCCVALLSATACNSKHAPSAVQSPPEAREDTGAEKAAAELAAATPLAANATSAAVIAPAAVTKAAAVTAPTQPTGADRPLAARGKSRSKSQQVSITIR